MTTVPVTHATVTQNIDICLATHGSINGKLLVFVDPHTKTIDRPVLLTTKHALGVFNGSYKTYDSRSFDKTLHNIEFTDYVTNVRVETHFRPTVDTSIVKLLGRADDDKIQLDCQNEQVKRLCERFNVP